MILPLTYLRDEQNYFSNVNLYDTEFDFESLGKCLNEENRHIMNDC